MKLIKFCRWLGIDASSLTEEQKNLEVEVVDMSDPLIGKKGKGAFIDGELIAEDVRGPGYGLNASSWKRKRIFHEELKKIAPN